MQGIQHLFRQHAIEKQSSIDSWHSANSPFLQKHYANGGRTNTTMSIGDDELRDLKGSQQWNQGKINQQYVVPGMFLIRLL